MKTLLTNLLLAAILLPDFGHAHIAVAPEPQQQTSSRKTIISRSLLSNPSIAALSREDCRIDAFAAASEEELIELIEGTSWDCIYLWEPLTIAFQKDEVLELSPALIQCAATSSCPP